MKKIEIEIPLDIDDTVYLMYGSLVRKAVIKYGLIDKVLAHEGDI